MLWLVIDRMALEPLETMVKERTRALVEANVGLSQEIEARQFVQEELRQREERISLLLNSIAEGIYGVDQQGECTFCNPAGLRLLGYESPQALIGKNIHALIHHTHQDGTLYTEDACLVYRCYRQGSGCHVDDELFWRADGTSFPVEYWAQPIMKDGVAVGAVTVFIDISQRKKSEQALLQAARDWQETFDAASDAIWILDGESRILRSNKAAEEMFQVPLSEMIGKHCWQIVHQSTEPIPHCPTYRVKKSGHRESTELQIGKRWLEVTVDPILDERGQCVRYVHSVSDITARRLMAEQLRQAQKMEAIGTLAGGIAHDFNNILNVIIGYTQLAQLDCADPDKVLEHLAEVSKGSERAVQLVRQILTFSRKTEEKRHPLQVGLIVKEAMKMLRASIPTTIQIKQQLSTDGTVYADPTQIHQVVMNLCTNAYQAMRETGGVLTVNLNEVELGAVGLEEVDLPAGSYLRLTVRDTGSGIDPQLLDKIFEPYFTTKGQGEGTGLGLAVVHGIVQNCNGQVVVESKPGEGTSFDVYLPLTEKEAASLRGEEKTPMVHGNGERLLFVDDEEQLCRIAATVFREHGYRVVIFQSPVLALAEFEKGPDQFDLVVTDMTMPQINGAEFARRIFAIRPELPVILCTGYSTLIDRDQASIAGISAYLPKPLSPQRLLEAVQQTLAERKKLVS